MTITVETTDNLDAVLELALPGTVIVLKPGTHYTRGNWVHRGWGYGLDGLTIKSIGKATAYRARIALRDPLMEWAGVPRKDKDVSPLWLGAGCRLEHLHIDGAAEENPGLNVTGLRFAGRFEVIGCDITGLRGDYQTKVESFVISSQGDTGGSIVSEVKAFGMVPNSYVSGIFLGGTVPTTRRSSIDKCKVDLGGGNWFAYSANYVTDIWDCHGEGAEAFFHNDTGPTVDCSIQMCHGETSQAGVRLIGVDRTIRELFVRDSSFKAPRGLVLWQHGEERMTGTVAMTGCSFDGEYAATIIAPHARSIFTQCDFRAGAEVQYRDGTEPPVFLQSETARGFKWVKTKA